MVEQAPAGRAGPPPPLAWAGGQTKLVLTGDLLDRGDDELEILDLVEDLRIQARAVGGVVIALLGNHEVMQALGDFRYTTPGGALGFKRLEKEILDELGGSWDAFDKLPEDTIPGLRARAAAFRPGGLLARRLARFPVAAKIDGTLFVHAALTREAVAVAGAPRAVSVAGNGAGAGAEAAMLPDLPLCRPNRAASQWLLGASASPPPRCLLGPKSMVWNRRFSEPAAVELLEADAAALGAALSAVGCVRMVVGHTPQAGRRAGGGPGCNAGGGGRVWRVDTGMARSMGGQPEALEITTFGSAATGECRIRVLTRGGPIPGAERAAWDRADDGAAVGVDSFS